MSAIDDAMAQLEGQIGQEIGVSSWVTVDQAMIDRFAETTFDTQWIHVDPARAAAETPFGGTIAHGFLTLSLASRFAYDCFPPMAGQIMSINYGFNRLRFLSPVRAGSRLRGCFTLKSAKKRSASEVLREYVLTVEIDGQPTPALVADWLGMVVFDPPS